MSYQSYVPQQQMQQPQMQQGKQTQQPPQAGYGMADIKDALKNQLAWYLCAENLARPDQFLLSSMLGPDMWVPVQLFLQFPKVMNLRADFQLLVACMREMEALELSADVQYVRPRNHALLSAEHTLLVLGPQTAEEVTSTLEEEGVSSGAGVASDRAALLIGCTTPQHADQVRHVLSAKGWRISPAGLARHLQRQQMPMYDQSQMMFNFPPQASQPPPPPPQQQQQQQPMMMYAPMQPRYPYMAVSPSYPPQMGFPMYMPDPMMMQMRAPFPVMEPTRHHRETSRRSSGDRRQSRSHSGGPTRDKSKGRSRDASRHRHHARTPRHRRLGSDSVMPAQSGGRGKPYQHQQQQQQQQLQQPSRQEGQPQRLSHEQVQAAVRNPGPRADTLTRPQHSAVVRNDTVEAVTAQFSNTGISKQSSYSAPTSPLDASNHSHVFSATAGASKKKSSGQPPSGAGAGSDHGKNTGAGNGGVATPSASERGEVDSASTTDHGQTNGRQGVGNKTWASVTKGKEGSNGERGGDDGETGSQQQQQQQQHQQPQQQPQPQQYKQQKQQQHQQQQQQPKEQSQKPAQPRQQRKQGKKKAMPAARTANENGAAT